MNVDEIVDPIKYKLNLYFVEITKCVPEFVEQNLFL